MRNYVRDHAKVTKTLLVLLLLVHVPKAQALSLGWLRYINPLYYLWSARPVSTPVPAQPPVPVTAANVDDPAVIREQWQHLLGHTSGLSSDAQEFLRFAAIPQDAYYLRLIRNLILPKLSGASNITVTFVGPTRAGKSTFMNTLLGHPVCSVGAKSMHTKRGLALTDQRNIDGQIFVRCLPNFKTRPLVRAEMSAEPVAEDDVVLMHHGTTGVSILESAIFVDLPDIDGIRQKNNEIAIRLAEASDLVVVVVRQGDYANEKVNGILSQMRDHAKDVVLVVTQMDERILSQNHSSTWKDWVADFTEVTGITPKMSFFVPVDMVRAASNSLPVYQAVGSRADMTMTEILEDSAATVRVANFFGQVAGTDHAEIMERSLLGATQSALYGGNGRGGIVQMLESIGARAERFEAIWQAMEKKQSEMTWLALPRLLYNDVMDKWLLSNRNTVVAGLRKTFKYLLIPTNYIASLFDADLKNEALKFQADEQERARELTQGLLETLNGLLANEGANFLSDESMARLRDVRLAERVAATLPSGDTEEFDKIFQTEVNKLLLELKTTNPEMLDSVLTADAFYHSGVEPVAVVASALGGLYLAAGMNPLYILTKLFTSTVTMVGAGIGGGAAGEVVSKTAKALTPFGPASKAYVAIQELYQKLQLARMWKALAKELEPVFKDLESGRKMKDSKSLAAARTCVANILAWAKAKTDVGDGAAP